MSFALGEYIAELRDRKSGDNPVRPRQEITIDETDLRKFPFGEFLHQRYPSESQPKGYLKVESVPPGAEIRMMTNLKAGLTNLSYSTRFASCQCHNATG